MPSYQSVTTESVDVLLTLEAMKMESAVTAPMAGKVARLPVSVGRVVDAKDLLAVIKPAA